MLKFLKNPLQSLFGTKQEKDVALYQPLVDEINEYFERLKGLSNDELRNKTKEFKKQIADHLAGIDEDLKTVRSRAIEMEDIHEKEALFKELDELQKERDKELEVILKSLLPEAFAVVKETARRFSENQVMRVTATDFDRDMAALPDHTYIKIEGNDALYANSWKAAGGDITWNMIHYDVQLIGGMVLHDGKIAEMQTGEGKTLVSTLPAYLNGISGQGVHIVTVNDYLARRDAEWNRPIFEFLFLTVDCIDKYRPHSPQRRAAYNADITYGTNNEFGFDYLRDNMKFRLEDYVQRELHYCIVDEVDSILIDEARTPLIISGPTEESTDKYYTINAVIPRLQKEADFTIEEKSRTAALTEEGVSKVEQSLRVDNLYAPENIELVHHVHQALKAHAIFKRDVDYVVK
ncbi:MAG: hypothetical protein KDC24_11385, partial [Saprospiraceae bacterium]|nr:hypothetical protein [Saprospiraceae bacterium]